MAARCGGQGEAVTAENVGNVLELDVCVCGGAPHRGSKNAPESVT